MVLALVLAWALAAQPRGPAADFEEANRLAAAGKLDEAIGLYERLAAAYPGNLNVLSNLGIAEYKRERYQAAASHFRSVLRLAPDSFIGKLFLGGSLLKQGDAAAAIPYLEQAVAAQPADRNARVLLGDALLAAGRPKDAAVQWRAALDRTAGDDSLRRKLVLALYDANDTAAGLRIAKEAVEAQPASAEWQFLYGAGLLEAQQIAQAISHLEQAIKLNPALTDAHAALGRAYLEAGDPEKAVPQSQLGLEGDTDGSRHYQLARALQAVGRKDEAAAALRKYESIRCTAPATPGKP
jgi:tetratricopeptide (TPR) repeat protein